MVLGDGASFMPGRPWGAEENPRGTGLQDNSPAAEDFFRKPGPLCFLASSLGLAEYLGAATGDRLYAMKHTLLLISALTALAAPLHAQNPDGFKELKIGDAAPDFKLIGIDHKTMALGDFKDSKFLAVAFTSNHCPVSNAAFPRFIKLYHEFKDRGFGVVAINPNHPDGLRPDELGYSKYGDSFEEMKGNAKDKGFPFPYLYDGETQTTAMAYGCLATPHIFLFDQDRKLRYKGRIDDCRFPGDDLVKVPDLRNALVALIEGKSVPVEITGPLGCSTKWRTKKAAVLKDDEKWASLPVSIETIDAAGVAKLVANPTNKYRLINIWSTTCAPCVEEFPGLVSVARRMGLRPFELITISTDAPEDKAKAEAFLKKNHAGLPGHLSAGLEKEGRKTNSYLYTEASMGPLIKVLDPEWKGTQPHTVLIAPGGEIAFRQEGPITQTELLEKVLAVLTPYFQPPK
jgi:peroxiredoxin